MAIWRLEELVGNPSFIVKLVEKLILMETIGSGDLIGFSFEWKQGYCYCQGDRFHVINAFLTSIYLITTLNLAP